MTITTRYFVVEPGDAFYGHNLNLVPDGDLLPLESLPAMPIATLEDGRVIVKALLTEEVLADLEEQLEGVDPLTFEGVYALDIANRYAGSTIEEVLHFFPELEGWKVIGQDLEGHDVLETKIQDVFFYGEKR